MTPHRKQGLSSNLTERRKLLKA